MPLREQLCAYLPVYVLCGLLCFFVVVLCEAFLFLLVLNQVALHIDYLLTAKGMQEPPC